MQDSSLTKEEARVLVEIVEHYENGHCPEPDATVLREAMEKLRSVMETGDVWKTIALQMHDPGECDYDHHGYCQAHSLHERPCPHETMRSLQET